MFSRAQPLHTLIFATCGAKFLAPDTAVTEGAQNN